MPTLSEGPGVVAPDRYQLLDELARGGMGVVFRAFDSVLDREVAIKVLQDRSENSAAVRRFVHEARVSAQLQHPAIPPVHDLGHQLDGRPFLAMKLIRGDTLDRLLKDRPNLAADRGRFVAAFEQICQAVAYAHAQGVIHRDLKPANVMVGNFGEVQVMDWGLAKHVGRPATAEPDRVALAADGADDRDPERTTVHHVASESTGAQTRAGDVVGTPAYMAPEQARGETDRVDRRSDVFALGGILCVILTGRSPFGGGEALRRSAAGDLDEATRRLDACDADPELVAICRRCLTVDPAGRPADADEVSKLVAEYRTGVEERLRAAELERAAAALSEVEQRKRRRVQRALAGAVGLIVLGAVAAGWWADRQASRERERKAREQVEAEVRQTTERDRLLRNAEGVGVLLTQAEWALRAGDHVRATVALDAADKRAREGGADDQADRIARLRADTRLLQTLAEVDRYRWNSAGSELPSAGQVNARLRTALAEFGVDPDTADPAAAAGRIGESVVAERVVVALDQLFFWSDPSARARALLRAVDPHPFRDAVRDAVLARDVPRVIKLTAAPEAADQPPGFTAVLGEDLRFPLDRRRELLRTALRRRPSDLVLLMAGGNAFEGHRLDLMSERLRWYQAAAALAPDNSAVQNNLSATLMYLGDVAGAEFAAREAMRLEPTDGAPYVNLGKALHRQRRFAEAEGLFQKALHIEPDNLVARLNLAGTLHAQGKLAEAAAECDALIGRNREYGPAHATLGTVRLDRKELEGAEASFREAIRLAPQYAPAHVGLGNLLLDRGQRDKAEAEYREAIKLDPRLPDAHFNLGVVLREKKDLIGAEATHREALKIDPLYVPAWNGLGNALRDQNRLPAAEAAFREAIRIRPEYDFAHNNLAITLALAGRLDDAIAEFHEALRLDPGNTAAKTNLAKCQKMKAERDAKEKGPNQEK